MPSVWVGSKSSDQSRTCLEWFAQPRRPSARFGRPLDLRSKAAENGQIADIALIEKRVLAGLPVGMRLPRELVNDARKNISRAAAILGPVIVENVYDLAPCWQPLIVELANVVSVEWHVIRSHAESLVWLTNSRIRVVFREPLQPNFETVSCANPKQEALEALRWARELLS